MIVEMHVDDELADIAATRVDVFSAGPNMAGEFQWTECVVNDYVKALLLHELEWGANVGPEELAGSHTMHIVVHVSSERSRPTLADAERMRADLQ